jgi:hypothetical protein
MIGQWLDTQPTTVLDRFLECKMVPFTQRSRQGEGCLVGVAVGTAFLDDAAAASHGWCDTGGLFSQDVSSPLFIGRFTVRFNNMCMRLQDGKRCGMDHPWRADGYALGGARAAQLIRTRVLRIKARRALGARREPVPA